MKTCSFISLFLLSLLSYAQEPVEMNDRAINNTDLRKSSSNSFYFEKLLYIKEQSVYSNCKEKQFESLLKNSKNPDIIYLVKKAEKNRKKEFIAFAAIPLGILAATCIRSNGIDTGFSRSIGITCLVASLSCIIISPFASNRKTANYREAVKLYNTSF
jgi:hypothetical protein